VDDGHVGDGDALGHGHEDVPSSARAGGGAIGGRARAIGEPREAAEGGLECGGNETTKEHLIEEIKRYPSRLTPALYRPGRCVTLP
jgi:hypothetical protein